MTVIAARSTAIVFAAGILAATPSAAWEIVPHRAIYEFDLASARMGSDVSDVGGQMLFQLEDSCDGWTVEQRYLFNYLYSQGQQIEQRYSYATWESKDGSDFNFTVRTVIPGISDDEVRGNARVKDDGSGAAEFRVPEVREEPLPRGTLFPTTHTLRLLDEAEQGAKFFVALLFDGSEEHSLSEISAVIGDLQQANDASSRELLRRPSWPIHMAFFSLEAGVSEPIYEMSATLYDNGILDDIEFHYGDFDVRATLLDLEPFEAPDC